MTRHDIIDLFSELWERRGLTADDITSVQVFPDEIVIEYLVRDYRGKLIYDPLIEDAATALSMFPLP